MEEEIIVTPKEAYQRIDHFLIKKGVGISRTRIQQLIKGGVVTVNLKSVKPNYKVHPKDRIILAIPPREKMDITPEEIPLEILFEDDQILAINKPANMVVHPAPGNYSGTLVNALLFYFNELSRVGGPERPGIIHRLDKETSGVIVVAKTEAAHNELSRQFKARKISKTYFAIVAGKMKKGSGKVILSIGRDRLERKKISIRTIKPRESITEYKVIRRFPQATFIEVKPHTGRTHQIRVHMAYLDHPIIGDKVYGGRRSLFVDDIKIDRHMLHAGKLGFIHPTTLQYMEISAPIPKDMEDLLEILCQSAPSGKNFGP